MHNFKRDPNYLLKYTVLTIAVFVALDLLLLATKGWSWKLSWSSTDLFLVIPALMLCGLPSSIMHNCAHGNVGPAWFNRAVGEVCGSIMLYGFGGFRLGHLFHHKYPDNPQYDPHPPYGLSFPGFLVAPVKATLMIIENAYYENFGHTAVTEANIRWQTQLFRISIVVKILFWILLFGPKLFLLFYVPLYVTNIFVFAHINYATHVDRADGQMEIINLNDGLYYRFVNMVSFGGYYHKNHHMRPKAFNPSKIIVSAEVSERSMLTYKMPASAAKPVRILEVPESRARISST